MHGNHRLVFQGCSAASLQLLKESLALRPQEFVPYLQRKVALDSTAVSGYEVLVRWANPELGLVFPDEFIHLVERNGLVDQLWRSVFSNICRVVSESANWKENRLPLAINISAAQIVDCKLPADALAFVREAGLEASDFEFEITENVQIPDVKQAGKVISQLRDAGFSVVLDDFGAGYSNVAHLPRLKLNGVKFDRAFMEKKEDGNEAIRASVLVSSLVAACHRIQLKVTTEGIEDLDDEKYARAVGADFGQGYFYHRPAPAHCVLCPITHRITCANKASCPQVQSR